MRALAATLALLLLATPALAATPEPVAVRFATAPPTAPPTARVALCGGVAPAMTHCEATIIVSDRPEGIEVYQDMRFFYGRMVLDLQGPSGRFLSVCNVYPPFGPGVSCTDTLTGAFYEGDILTLTVDAGHIGGYYNQVWGSGPVGFWQASVTA